MNQLRRGPVLLALLTVLAACTRLPSPLAVAPTATLAPSATSAPASALAASPLPTAPPVLPTAPALSATPVSSATPVPPSATPAPPTATFEPLDPTPTLAALSAEERTKIFEQVWTIVRDNYVYEDYRGVDWNATRAEFVPRAEAAETPEEFYGVMRELIERLGDDHSRFESPQEVAAQQAEYKGDARYGGIGAKIRDVEDGGLVVSLAPGGPAERAGIRQRDVVLAVNGVPFIDTFAHGPDGPIGAVRGVPGTSVQLTVRSGDEAPREVSVVREPIPNEAFNTVRSSVLPGTSVGLVEIPTFYVEELDLKVRTAVEALLAAQPLKGLILDVRSNSGGYVHLMRNTIGLFHDGGSIGSTSGRSIYEDQVIPSGKTIKGLEGVPVMVLVGPDSASAAEMFAAGMQTLGRALIVGLPSAGNTENLYSYNFDDGSRLLLATVAYRKPDGSLIEGQGVIPDRYMDVEWWRYPPDLDPQIRAAVEEIDAIVQVGTVQ